MKTLSMQEMKPYYDQLKSNELILDVRTPEDFAQSHVPGAKLIPFDQVMNHAEELKGYAQIYVYCRSGGRSYNACMILSTLGLQNLTCIDEGGMPDWDDAGYPAESA